MQNASGIVTHSPWSYRLHSRSVAVMNIKQRLASNVKQLRSARGWSQEDLADHAGLDRTYISGIERTVRNPTITVIERLAKAFSTKIGDLLD